MKKSVYFRAIGDIHSYTDVYEALIKDVPYTLQLGDYGWGGEPTGFFDRLNKIDPTRHLLLKGNHDDYSRSMPHHLNDFGLHSIPLRQGSFDFFYIRGAQSIDKESRIIGVSWWPEEELTWDQGHAALDLYKQIKPRTVFTHDCPDAVRYFLKSRIYRPSLTQQILQACFDTYQPETWFFGHWHVNMRQEFRNTVFICLDGEMPSMGHKVGYIDFDEDGHLLTPHPLHR
jgi:hypothetical protein